MSEWEGERNGWMEEGEGGKGRINAREDQGREGREDGWAGGSREDRGA